MSTARGRRGLACSAAATRLIYRVRVQNARLVRWRVDAAVAGGGIHFIPDTRPASRRIHRHFMFGSPDGAILAAFHHEK